MNKLTPIFIVGALFVACGLAYVQSQMDDQGQGATMNHGEHAGYRSSTSSDNSVVPGYSQIND